MPDNGDTFQRFLRKNANQSNSHLLTHVRFAVLGLGSTDYSKYMHAPRYVHQKLRELGAKEFYYMGEADDATGLEATFEPWLEGIQAAVLSEVDQLNSLTSQAVEDLLKPIAKDESTTEVAENSSKPTSYTFYLKQKEVR